MKPPWHRPMWRRSGSHRRRPWPDVPTTKDLHRYLGNPLADTRTPDPVSTTAILATFSTTNRPTEEAEAYEPSPPELDSPMPQSEGSSSALAILHDGYFLHFFTFISHSLLLLCLVTWRVGWPLAHTIISRLPHAVEIGARALAEELRTDISCLCRGLGRGLRSMAAVAVTPVLVVSLILVHERTGRIESSVVILRRRRKRMKSRHFPSVLHTSICITSV